MTHHGTLPSRCQRSSGTRQAEMTPRVSQNGIHKIRSSDGGGFQQITSNPGGDDVPGSWSPGGKRIVFQRFGPDSYEGVFVVNVKGTGLKQILPPTIQAGNTLNWSPQGNEIAFSRHVTPGVHSSLWIVHSDGTGLRPVSVQPARPATGRTLIRPRTAASSQPGRRTGRRSSSPGAKTSTSTGTSTSSTSTARD